VDFTVIDFDQVLRDAAPQHKEGTSCGQDSIADSSRRESGMSPQSIQGHFTRALGVGTRFKIKPADQSVSASVHPSPSSSPRTSPR